MKKASKAAKFVVALLILAGAAIIGYDAVTGNNLLQYVKGWYALFIIIPGLFGMIFSKHSRLGAFGLTLFGALLLLRSNAESWFAAYPETAKRIAAMEWWKVIILPIMLVVALSILGSVFGIRKRRIDKIKENIKNECRIECDDEKSEYNAVFGDSQKSYSGEKFNGAEVNGVFSTFVLDLRGAMIESNCEIEANAVFGSVEIFVDGSVNVEVESTHVFGNVSNSVSNGTVIGMPTVRIDANAVFGNVKITN